MEAKPLTLGRLMNLSDGKFNYLSNAVFGFALAIIVYLFYLFISTYNDIHIGTTVAITSR